MWDVWLVHEKCTLLGWAAPRFCGLELGLTGGLWHYWLSKTSLSCWSSSYCSQPQQSTCCCITLVLIQSSLLGMEFPRAAKHGKSAGLRAILLSLSQVQCLFSLGSPLPLYSSIGYTLCLYSAWPGCVSAHTYGPQHHPRLNLLLETKAEFTGSWSQKGIFSVEGACSSVNMIKDGFFLGEAGCSLSFSLKLASCIQWTIPEQPRVKADCRASLINSPGQARPVVESSSQADCPLSFTTSHPSHSLSPPFFSGGKKEASFCLVSLPLHSCPDC